MDQKKTPLYTALIEHSSKKPISLHVPGHKYGEVFPTEERDNFRGILKLDSTEITGLDDLHSPEGPIREAQILLANLYGAYKSFFLVNGSTSGNLAMVMAACKVNDVVLVQRNCHKSIMNALKLAKAKPVFLGPDYLDDWKIASGISRETVEKALEVYPQAKALILTYPNYYGIAADMESIISLAHEKNIPVLVDEAHGAHFKIGGSFPSSAVELGADIVVQSAHKTLPAMTMGSYLHFNSQRIKLEFVEEYLRIFQSSSPSYPIMASLDLARGYLGTYEEVDKTYVLKQIDFFRQFLKEIPQIKVLEYPNGQGDPLKITIQSACGLSGFEIQSLLEANGIYTELADPFNVLFVFPLLKDGMEYPVNETLEKIRRSLKDIKTAIQPSYINFKGNVISELTIPFDEMSNYEAAEIPLHEAVGEIAAESIVPYPPGIPLILAGERITILMLENLLKLRNSGARFQGGSIIEKNMLKVFRP